MSITITGEFASPQQARQAAQKLRRRGYTVSGKPQARDGVPGSTLLVAHPFGAPGGRTPSSSAVRNSLMGAMPPVAENGVTAPAEALVSVLTDDTQAADCRRLMTALGGRIL